MGLNKELGRMVGSAPRTRAFLSHMRDFFAVPNASDPLYRLLAAHPERGRIVHELWERVEPFVDTRRPQAAAVDFHATFWEIYLAAALVEANISLVPRDQRRTTEGGPDIEARPTTWIEAIVASGGRTEHGVRDPEVLDISQGVAMHWVPDDKLLVRIESALRSKREKYVSYRNRGIVRGDEPYVIAVNGGLMPFGNIDSEVPRVVRVAFGLGELTVTVDVETGKVVKEEWPPLLKVPSGRNEVLLGLFARPEYDFVSAILWGTADALNVPPVLGRDLIVVRNPRALAPLPEGWLRAGREYWVEGAQLRERSWWKNAG